MEFYFTIICKISCRRSCGAADNVICSYMHGYSVQNVLILSLFCSFHPNFDHHIKKKLIFRIWHFMSFSRYSHPKNWSQDATMFSLLWEKSPSAIALVRAQRFPILASKSMVLKWLSGGRKSGKVLSTLTEELISSFGFLPCLWVFNSVVLFGNCGSVTVSVFLSLKFLA